MQLGDITYFEILQIFLSNRAHTGPLLLCPAYGSVRNSSHTPALSEPFAGKDLGIIKYISNLLVALVASFQ